MFSWIAGDSCKGSCIGSDPTTDTVRFVPPDVSADQQEQERRQQEMAEKQEQLRLELERTRADELERQRQERERQERERKERQEKERLEQERLAREREEERLRLEEQRRKEEEAVRLEAQRIEKERLAAQERARKDQEQLQSWLQKNKYAGVNAKKTKLMLTRYPLHEAVYQKDATALRLLLRFGADPAAKNTSGKTAQELANSTKASEEILAAFTSQSRMKIGGA